MNKFRFNLKGQLNEIKLPAYKTLWPLFETIVNSIQSIEDSINKQSGKIIIQGNRVEDRQIDINGEEETNPFYEFIVKDNGNGFNEANYNSFLEAYTTLKIEKGCKGIGRFLWLKAFSNVHIASVYNEKDVWKIREFDFTADKGIEPDKNENLSINEEYETVVTLSNFANKYRKEAPVSLEIIARKIIEHCLPYFIGDNCPNIILNDNLGEKIDLNNYYDKYIKDSLHRDQFEIMGEEFALYNIMMGEGANRHELHFCANKREVKSYELKQYIPDLNRKIVDENGKAFYYLGYIIGGYLDRNVNLNRTAFDFGEEDTLIHKVSEEKLINTAKEYVLLYLKEDLEKIKKEKIEFINNYVQYQKPQYKYVLNKKPEIYEKIPAGLKSEKLELELHKATQEWETEIKIQCKEIEDHVKDGAFDQEKFEELFNEYCNSISEISKASLSEYVIRRKAILDLLERSLEMQEDNHYRSESSIHSIICPMRYTSDEIQFEEMNLWIIDDRLSYHRFLASDKQMKSLPILNSSIDKRMDLAIFDQVFSFSPDNDSFNSITIIEFKRPNRNDLKDDYKNPINQVLGYVDDIKSGKVNKANGRPFGNVNNTAFYCYVIADLTETLKKDALNADLNLTPDGEGYYGYNRGRGAYIEVISYNKLIKDAKQRNQILFEKLFNPKVNEVINSKLLISD
jgi:hypothetical protein